MTRVERGDGWELRLGKWQDVLADVECDALISDPPYLTANAGGGGMASAKTNRQHSGGGQARNTGCLIRYAPATTQLLSGIASMNSRGFRVVFNDFEGVALIRESMKCAGLTVSEPVTWVKNHGAPFGGFLNVAKRCEWLAIGHHKPGGHERRPGVYKVSYCTGDLMLAGGKPLPLMRAIIRDYSRPDDLVCDPCAGGGTTLLAAVTEGRRAIGAECDPDTFELAVKRLRAGHTRSLFTAHEREPEPETGDLFGGAA